MVDKSGCTGALPNIAGGWICWQLSLVASLPVDRKYLSSVAQGVYEFLFEPWKDSFCEFEKMLYVDSKMEEIGKWIFGLKVLQLTRRNFTNVCHLESLEVEYFVFAR